MEKSSTKKTLILAVILLTWIIYSVVKLVLMVSNNTLTQDSLNNNFGISMFIVFSVLLFSDIKRSNSKIAKVVSVSITMGYIVLFSIFKTLAIMADNSTTFLQAATKGFLPLFITIILIVVVFGLTKKEKSN